MVSDPRETYVNPPAALDAAARLTATGETFASRWAEVAARITAASGNQPWGTDEPGREFARNYSQGDPAPEATLLAAIGDLAQALSELGPSVTESVHGTVDTDDETGRSMRA